MGLRLVSGAPTALEEALAAELGSAQEADPLTPVGVLIGGTLQRPYLQRRVAELNDGIVNVRFLVPSEFALELGEHNLIAVGKRPLPPLADRILLRAIADEHDGYFAPVRETPGLADALHRLVRELRGAGYDASSFEAAITDACDVPEKARTLAEMFSDFLERRADFYGPDDCLLVADPKRTPWRELLVFGLWQAPAALTQALVAIANELPVTVFLPSTGAEDADTAHRELRQAVTAAGADAAVLDETDEKTASALDTARHSLFRIPRMEARLDETLNLISGPDPAREVREVARQCLAWAREGIRFHEMAVAYRHPDPYRSLIESVFIEAGVPTYLHEGTPMSERPLGRKVLALLALMGSDFERRAVMDFLSDGRLPRATWEHYGKVSAASWDRFSRRAGVVRGLEQWEQRLAAYRNELAASDRDWDKQDATRVDSLLAFVRDLAKALADHPGVAPWSEHLTGLKELLSRYVEVPDPILGSLDALSRFDALGEQVSHERFRQAVESAIEHMRTDEVEAGRSGAFGLRGVNVLDANSLRHLRFRAVAIVGVAERSFPAPPRPDPILLDHERERLNAAGPAPIPLRVRGADPEPLQFALATHAAREHLLVSYARKGSTDSRPQLPSRFFRALAEAAMGQRIPAQGVDRLPPELYRRASGSRIGAASLDVALSAGEYDRTLLEADEDLGRAVLTRAEPRIERALEARRSRFLAELTEFDGVLTEEAVALLADVFDPGNGVSPSLLESYAACPQRVFLGNVLRARREEEPEETVRLSAGDRGTLIHRILERFLGEPPDNGEALLHGPREEARLLAIAEEEFDLCETRGETGYPAIWRPDRLELIEDLRGWLAAEHEDEVFGRLNSGAYEIRFGYGRRDSDSDGGLSQDEPLDVRAGHTHLKVSGRIDRLNWDEAKTAFRVVDYKTGSANYKPADGTLDGGGALQLPLYIYAAARLLNMRPNQGEAEYHYPTRKGRYLRSRFNRSALAEKRASLEEILALMVDGMGAGAFHLAPENDGTCMFCDFNELCPTSRFRLVRRKQGAPAAQTHQQIRGIE